MIPYIVLYKVQDDVFSKTASSKKCFNDGMTKNLESSKEGGKFKPGRLFVLPSIVTQITSTLQAVDNHYRK